MCLDCHMPPSFLENYTWKEKGVCKLQIRHSNTGIKELIELAEAISKNVHEVWSQNRMDEGWTYGPVRNDEKKETPCLVPYEELPEIEKAYDRDTAFNTLKYIVSLGFKIIK